MNNHKVTFTLKQHTPIIHFQSDQSGATIRASELKPKFDRFLIKYAFEGKKELYKAFLIDKNKKALRYKVRIINKGSSASHWTYKTYVNKKNNDGTQRVGSYFGDNLALEFDDTTEVSFLVSDKKLTLFIREFFERFILLHNFGTRQNKGFGSFSVVAVDGEPVERTPDEIASQMLLHYPKIYTRHSNEPLKKIQQDYQKLKSGQNRPYTKSYLFEYMCSRDIRWEKRMIKQYMQRDYPSVYAQMKFEKAPVDCKLKEDNFYYIRALLGTADQIEFLKKNSRNSKDKIKIKIKAENSDIKRYKSPITFKVIDNTVYVFAETDNPIGGEHFTFAIDKSETLHKSIPVPKNFDIYAFLDYGLAEKLNYTPKKART